MRYGIVFPDAGIPVRQLVELARQAEDAGWDGVFYWDASYFEEPRPLYDPWIVLAAIAMRTERVQIGAILFALYRRRPWEVAREAVTLDHLSNGRLIVPAGLGAPEAHGGARFGLPTDRRTRAELLDEGLEILAGLWRGQPYSHAGRHYRFEAATFLPTPVQQPRIPIWVVGAWPSERSMARAVRYDGILAARAGGEPTPDDVGAIAAYARAHRPADAPPIDVIAEGRTPADDPGAAAAQVRPWAAAGATWWTETMWTAPSDLTAIEARIRSGPPRSG